MTPNVFLAGAPKCGTSSLFSWLAAHPDVEGTSPKEPFYLMDVDSPLAVPSYNVHTHGAGGYRRFFGADHSVPVRLDGCCQYLYQQTALDFVRTLPGRSTVLVIVRNPVARVRSGMQYFAPKSASVTDALDLLTVTDSLLGRSGPARFVESDRYEYLLRNLVHHSEYVFHLRRWRDALAGSNATLVVRTFEEMRRAPHAFLESIAGAHLGIDPHWFAGKALGQENATRTPRYRTADRWIRGIARRSPGAAQRALRNWNAEWNTVRIPETARDVLARNHLRTYFTPWNAALAAEFDVDIDGWNNAAA